VHLIQELWIISGSGLTLYNQRIGESINKDLFGGFISAIDNFVQEMGGDCKRIEMGDSLLLIEKCKDPSIIIVCRSGKKNKQKKIEKYMGKIKEEIFKHHKEKIKTWDGNTETFDDFSNFINIKDDPENYLGVKLDKNISKQVLDQL